MRIAVFPGGFDPVTNGHLDLVTRMTHLFDRVIVAVVKGRDKGSLFTWDERIDMFRKAVEHLPTVEVEGFDEVQPALEDVSGFGNGSRLLERQVRRHRVAAVYLTI